MYTLINANVVKIVESDEKKNLLLSKGFTLVDSDNLENTANKYLEDKKFTKEELLALCKERQIEVKSAATKTEIIMLLEQNDLDNSLVE